MHKPFGEKKTLTVFLEDWKHICAFLDIETDNLDAFRAVVRLGNRKVVEAIARWLKMSATGKPKLAALRTSVIERHADIWIPVYRELAVEAELQPDSSIFHLRLANASRRLEEFKNCHTSQPRR